MNLGQWFSTGDDFAAGDIYNVWRHFWVSQLRGCCPVQTVTGAEVENLHLGKEFGTFFQHFHRFKIFKNTKLAKKKKSEREEKCVTER